MPFSSRLWSSRLIDDLKIAIASVTLTACPALPTVGTASKRHRYAYCSNTEAGVFGRKNELMPTCDAGFSTVKAAIDRRRGQRVAVKVGGSPDECCLGHW